MALPPNESSARPGAVPLVFLALLAVLVAAIRLYSYDEPLERDLTTYAVVAHEMLQGRELYSDLWDHKPPLVHLTYALGELAAGYGPGEAYFLGVMSTVITMLGVYVAALAVHRSYLAALWAPTFWVAISSNIGLQANQPNTEAFINACLTWAFVLLLRVEPSPGRVGRAVAVGLLFALATLYKNVVITTAFFLTLAHVLFPPGARSGRAALRQFAIIAGVGAAAWLSVFGYFAALGRFDDFYGTVFAYNYSYSGGTSTILKTFLRSFYYPYFLKVFLGLLALTVCGAVIGLKRGPKRQWALLVGFAVGSQCAIPLHGRLLQHYYQFWLPVLAIGAAWGMASVRDALPDRRKWVAPVLAAAALAATILYQLPVYKFPARELPAVKYDRGGLFIESREVGEQIGALLEPGETFYQWGSETGLYFASKCSPPTGVFYNYPLCEGPLQEALTQRVLADLERNPPELLVLPSGRLEGHPVVEWLKPRYELFPVEPVRGSFVLLFRRGGKLETRLRSNKERSSPDE